MLGAWCVRPKAGALAFLLLLTPWLAWRGNREVIDLLDAHRATTVFDQAGLTARSVVPTGKRVRIAADNVGEAYRTMFSLDRADSSFVISKPDESVRITEVDEGQWLLVVPGRPVEGTATVTRAFDGFVLLRR